MSLRFRVVLAIVLVLFAGSAVGIALAGWQAHLVLGDELSAALTGGRQTVASAFEDLPTSEHARGDIVRLVASFDGDRHLQAMIVDSKGTVTAISHPLAETPAPAWFVGVMAPRPTAIETPIPLRGAEVLRLTPLAGNDVSAIWSEFVDLALVLAASIVVTAVLAWLTVGHALRPLDDASAAFLRLGSGRYDTRLEPRGALELRGLAEGFNDMTGRLSALQARTQALERQILTLQDEERADLARDLHDEIGPHLFAVSVDATMARRLITAGSPDQATEHLTAIQDAVGRMKRMVRDILGRLRPAELIELGLASAIAEMVAFWRGRHPEIEIAVRAPSDDDAIPSPVREALYRFVQEGLNNAIRHGRPDRVEVEIALAANGALTARIADDGARASAPGPEGFGLLGMRERLAAIGGRLEIRRGASGGGWVLFAEVPPARASADLLAISE